jgi:hypothetical protein
MLLMLSCRLMNPTHFQGVVDAALLTLEDDRDVAAIAELFINLRSMWPAVHSHYLKTTAQQLSPGGLPVWLICCSAYQAVGSVMHDTAMEQLAGTRQLGDWEPVLEVSTASAATAPWQLCSYMPCALGRVSVACNK